MSKRYTYYGSLSAGFVYDADALTYFTAASITDETEKLAVNTLILGLKTDSLWTGLNALYLMSPTSLAAASVNAKSPGTFDIVWINSPTHSTTGVSMNGSTQYGKMGIVPQTHLITNDVSFSVYTQVDVPENGRDIGGQNSTSQRILFDSNRANGAILVDVYSGTTGRINGGTSGNGLILVSRRTSTDMEAYRNGVSQATIATSGGTTPSFALFLGALNSSGTPVSYTSKEYSFAHVGSSLTDTDSTNLYNRVQTYQTNVIIGGRNV